MFSIGATIGKIFGTEKALTSIIDNVSNGLDALIYTDEEKAGDAAKDRAAARGMVIKWMESTKGQNLARRVIALSIVSVWLIQYLSCMVLSVAGIWVEPMKQTIGDNTVYVNPLIESAQVIGEFAEKLNSPIMLILAFYFSAPYMGDIAKGVLSKFGKKN
jgi:hypothetical protein